MTLAFQTEFGGAAARAGGPVPIAAWAPMVLFAILFGLSMDYEVFMLSRVRERLRADRRHPRGGGASGSVTRPGSSPPPARSWSRSRWGSRSIRVSWSRLSGSVSPSAILVDVTIARLVLVPATMALLGDRNWYMPRWLGGRAQPAPRPAPPPRRSPRRPPRRPPTRRRGSRARLTRLRPRVLDSRVPPDHGSPRPVNVTLEYARFALRRTPSGHIGSARAGRPTSTQRVTYSSGQPKRVAGLKKLRPVRRASGAAAGRSCRGLSPAVGRAWGHDPHG